MRYSFFLIVLLSLFISGCTTEKELQPEVFFIPEHTITILKIDDQSIGRELLWETIQSGKWEHLFKKGSDLIIDLIQNKSKYGLSTDIPLYLFTYKFNDSTYKTGLILRIKDSLQLTSSLPFKKNTAILGNHLGTIAHQNLYIYFNSDSGRIQKFTPFVDSFPSWNNQYLITGVIFRPSDCSQLSTTYLAIQLQNQTINIHLSSNHHFTDTIQEVKIPEGLYLNTSLAPLRLMDSCLFDRYQEKTNPFITNLKDKQALLSSTFHLHWMGWDTITTKEYKTFVNDEFETILKPVYQSHSYPLLKIRLPNDTSSTRLLQWAEHQKIIKKQNAQKYMCVLGVQKSFVYIDDNNITYLPEKFPLQKEVHSNLLFSYQPGSLRGMTLQKNIWKQHQFWDQWMSQHILNISLSQNTSDYLISITFQSNDSVLLSLFKLIHSMKEQLNAHNLDEQ